MCLANDKILISKLWENANGIRIGNKTPQGAFIKKVMRIAGGGKYFCDARYTSVNKTVILVWQKGEGCKK